ncbi:hypothetical protein ALC62_14775 [Cyphomyrmex costatus]|uniref:THAP-type domain-containing protein n=1 Tax=Cyphomyrmex costatus TaxID=456900 RepID=A0A151I8E1_9HYME|nr:hypothetical protein ALC62_14775 [Cyphomyrmex costatus]
MYYRAIIWAKAVMRNDLIPKVEKLYESQRLCAAHFQDKDFTNYLKNRLLANAIPTMFQSLQDENLTQENGMIYY